MPTITTYIHLNSLKWIIDFTEFLQKSKGPKIAKNHLEEQVGEFTV